MIGLGLLALFLWRKGSLGSILRSFVAILTMRIVLELGALVIAWTTLLVLIAERFGLWDPSLLRDTILSLLPAASLLGGATNAASEEGWYRRHIRRAIGLTVFVEVIIGLTSFNLAVEVILLIVLALAAMIAALAGTRYDTSGGLSQSTPTAF